MDVKCMHLLNPNANFKTVDHALSQGIRMSGGTTIFGGRIRPHVENSFKSILLSILSKDLHQPLVHHLS